MIPGMTPHRSNSSELESQPFFKDFFSKYLDAFVKDFEFGDVQAKVGHKIFSEEECERIDGMAGEELQVVLMFTLLLEKNKDIRRFLELIKDDYDWLYQSVRQDQQKYGSGDKEMQNYVEAVHELTVRFPKYTNLNIRRIQYYSKLRQYMINLKPRQYLVVSGELGFGKKWLVLDVCRDYAVFQAMNFKIFWLDVYDCDTPEKDLECLQRLKIHLGKRNQRREMEESIGMSNKILEIQQYIRNILKEEDFKDSLLILSNVKNQKTVQAFNFPCKILIITRNKKIADNLSKHSTKILTVANGFNTVESLELFKKILNKSTSEFPTNFSALIEESKGHPFLLTTIAQNLKERSIVDSNKWIENLLSDFQIRDDKIEALIALSLRALRSDELEIYKTLCIFNHSVKIPLTVLSSYWNTSEWETNKLIDKFDKFSLVSTTKLKSGARACTLHFLYYAYLQNLSEVDKQKLNCTLIESYGLTKKLEERDDVYLSIGDDEYFFYYIGHHLKAANELDLLSILYLDFGFIEQKLRATGLPNTIGDLKYFLEEITQKAKNVRNGMLLDALLDFLPNIEEIIFKSEDACLLQYALMTNEILGEEAIQQASRYTKRVWFHDSDHFHERRQMVRLRKRPKVLCLVDPDSCIAALEDHTIFFADLSCDYNTEPIVFVGHESEIVKITLFDKYYFISLDVNGVMKCWSIEKERNQCAKKNTKLLAKQIDYSTLQNARKKPCLQTINRSDHPDLQAKCFYLETQNNNTTLHTVISDGRILRHHWNPEKKRFEKDSLGPLVTKDRNISFVLKVLHQYMVLNDSGSISFFDLIDGSKINEFKNEWIIQAKLINIHYFKGKLGHVVIFVFNRNIVQLTVPEGQELQSLVTDPIDYLYEADDTSNYIICSVLSQDNRFLILGTIQGILVFDVTNKTEVLRNSISEQIVCLDICSQDDEFYKYIIVSGSENEAKLNIFGLKLSWNAENRNVSPDIQLKPNTWLVGQKLFDVISSLDDELSVIAIDSKNCIHHFKNNRSSTPIGESLPSKITAIAAAHNEYFLGFESGEVHDSRGRKILSFLTPSKVTFLEILQDIIICSTQYDCIISKNRKTYRFDIGVVKCFIFKANFLVLINPTCGFTILDVKDDFHIVQNIPGDRCLGASDLQANTLFLAAEKYVISFYELSFSDILETNPFSRWIKNDNIVTDLAASVDGSICAIGYETGVITLLKRENDWKELHNLISHTSRIYDLKFSPWNNDNIPTILVSMSEQICFWNITHVINNPMQRGSSHRYSSRFNSRLELLKQAKRRSLNYPSPSTSGWCNKEGPPEKPELLSCVKFIGSKAEKFYSNDDFTKFITIDNEGEVYFLCIDDTKFVDRNIQDTKNI